MRRWLEAISLVSFGGFLLIVSMLSAMGPKFVLAQSNEPLGEVMQQEVENGAREEERVDYYLPYPGILPDHPLYFLKMVRDRLVLLMTRDPVQRTEKLLLYADKRIGAARVLWEGNQIDLAVTTATKAEKYMEQVVGSLEQLVDTDELAGLTERVDRALRKHEELLGGMLSRAEGVAAKTLRQSVELTGQGRVKLQEFREQGGLGTITEGEEIMEATESAEEREATEGAAVPVELRGTL